MLHKLPADIEVDREVISLAPPDGWASAEVSDRAKRFLDYWQSIRGGRPYPRKIDIDPGAILELLPNVFLAEILPGDPIDYRYRLVGTAIVGIEGEYTGRTLSEVFEDRDRYCAMWDQYALAAAGAVNVRRESLRWRAEDYFRYEVALTPLQDETGTISMLFGLAHDCR